MRQIHLLLRALRWRASATVALLVVATVAVIAASAGPFYYSAVSDHVLNTTLAGGTAGANGITAIPSPALLDVPSRARAIVPLARHYRLGRWYAPPITTFDSGVTVAPNAEGLSFNTDLLSRTDVCDHLTFIAGSCPTAADQVAISKRSALILQASLGSRVMVRAHNFPTPITVAVVGIVRVGTARASYWMGDNFFDYTGLPTSPANISAYLHLHRAVPGAQLPVLDAFFTVPATVTSLPLSALVQYRLRVHTVNIENVDTLLSADRAFKYASNTEYQAPAFTLLIGTIEGVTTQDTLMLAIVVVVSLELVLLTLFVLYGLVTRTVEARQPEIALAKLHGFRQRSVLAVGLLEPLIILVASVPLGILLSWLVVRLVSALLLANSPVYFSPLVVYAALAAFGGGLLATVFGAVRILARRLSDELTGAEAKPSIAGRAAFEGVVVVLAIAAIVELRVSGVLSGGEPNSLALFGPGLVAVAIGVLGVRLVPILCAAAIHWTENTAKVATHLAVRQVARRPANLRQILVLALATGLATFAVIGWSVAASNRVIRADFETGAAEVLKVNVPASVNLVSAVRKADPSGKYAMAVAESITSSQALLAVDASRLSRVSYWQNSVSTKSARQLAKWLEPRLSPLTMMTGTQARLTVTMPTAVDPEPDLEFNLIDPGTNLTLVDFGQVEPGTHTYVTQLPPTCVGGCRVTSLAPYWTPNPGGPQSVSYSMTLSNLETRSSSKDAWSKAFGGFSRLRYWQPIFPGVTAQETPSGELVTHWSESYSELLVPELAPGLLPPTIPGVTTIAAQESDPVSASLEDFDGTELTVNLSRETVALPRLGEYGFLLDLPLAMRAAQGAFFSTSEQVWLAPHTPSRVIRSLRRSGLKILSVQTPAPLLKRFNQGGLAFGYLFFLFAAAAAALMAAGSGVATVLMSARGRGFELAVLRAVGVPRRTLLASLLAEQSLVVLPGIALGLGAGILGAVMALSSVPQFGSNAGAPVPATTLPWLTIVVAGLVMLIVLAATGTLTAMAALRRATYQTLRGEIL